MYLCHRRDRGGGLLKGASQDACGFVQNLQSLNHQTHNRKKYLGGIRPFMCTQYWCRFGSSTFCSNKSGTRGFRRDEHKLMLQIRLITFGMNGRGCTTCNGAIGALPLEWR